MQLEIKNLTKTYANGITALKDVSLSVGTGMFGLLGENGAGKSTLMRIIATLQDADAGSVCFGDIDVLAEPEVFRRRLGYLPQEFGVYPSVTAEELLLYLADLKGIVDKGQRVAQVEALLNKVNLWEARKRKIGGFSGGMKQRFGIAQALLGNPELIIVDEPTAGLDPVERNRFYNLLSEIGEHTVVILSTHIVEDVSTLCNNMAILGRGKVLCVGTPAQLEQSLEGVLWTKSIEKEALSDYCRHSKVLSSHFHLGTFNITVHADSDPGDGFVPKTPSLEDTYFYTLGAVAQEPVSAG